MLMAKIWWSFLVATGPNLSKQIHQLLDMHVPDANTPMKLIFHAPHHVFMEIIRRWQIVILKQRYRSTDCDKETLKSLKQIFIIAMQPILQ